MSAACLWWLVSWWPADSCVGIVESRLQCPTIHHYTLSLPLCSAAAFFPPDHWPLDRTLTTGVEKLSQLKLLPLPAADWKVDYNDRYQTAETSIAKMWWRVITRKCQKGEQGHGNA